eukprot:9752370-Karenia_brevis.AAC.1
MARRLLAQLGLPTLLEQVAGEIHSWAGHLARLDPAEHAVGCAVRWRSEQWWRREQAVMSVLDPRNVTGWKHHRPGTHQRWDSQLYDVYGAGWMSTALDRGRWRRLRD